MEIRNIFSFYTISGAIVGLLNTAKELTEINIPETIEGYDVISIGNVVFADCKNLVKVTIPSSVRLIGHGAFFNCEKLEEVIIDARIADINHWTFKNCKSLKKITIPKGVTNIGDSAFSGCESLQSLVIPEGITNISNYAFDCCISLKSVTLPSTLTNIGEHAFEYCTSLIDIYYAGTKEDWDNINILNGNDILKLANIHYEKENKIMENKTTSTNLFNGLTENIIMHERIHQILMQMNSYQCEFLALNQLRCYVSYAIDAISVSKNISEDDVRLFQTFISGYKQITEKSEFLYNTIKELISMVKDKTSADTLETILQGLLSTKSNLFSAYDKLCQDLDKIIEFAKSNNELVTIEADVFIIPNSVGTLDHFLADSVRDRIDNYANGIMKAAGLEYNNKKEKFVECWFCNNDSDNFADHGVCVLIDGKEYKIFAGTIDRYLPVSIFEGHVEGDKVKVIIPNVKCVDYDGKSKDEEITKVVDLEMILTLNQKSYRYRNYGTFDELLKSLCSR